MSDYLKIYEVGPRDGLQNESVPIDTAQKLILIEGLVSAGLREIEVTSFVHPKAVPQMADADDVMRSVMNGSNPEPVRFIGLVFNQRGYDRAIAAGCRAMAFGISVSDTFSMRNTRMSSEEAIQVTGKLVRQAKNDGIWTRVYISAAWICPFDGPMPPQRTIAYADRVWDMGVDELVVADTIGHANPLEVGRLLERLGRRIGMEQLAVHLHDTQAMGLANATTAIQAGVRIFDTSIGGIGGCPFAPGAAGNLATEDLVFMAYRMGLGTGVDFDRLWGIVLKIEQSIGRPIGGRIRPWWESTCRIEPSVEFK
jgi:hydroxymethylglutaryl-CoA lyase